MNPLQKGFTLIELMIVVVIIAILAAFAYGSYQEHTMRARRAECQSVLENAATMLERQYSAIGKYPVDWATTKPSNFPNKCPNDGNAAGQKFYQVDLTADDTTFTLTATPQGIQAGDKCGTLKLNQTGEKLAGGGAITSGCW